MFFVLFFMKHRVRYAGKKSPPAGSKITAAPTWPGRQKRKAISTTLVMKTRLNQNGYGYTYICIANAGKVYFTFIVA